MRSGHNSKSFLATRARFARTREGNVVHFSAKPKNEPPLLLLCERSEHKKSVFCKKTIVLGYAHFSIKTNMNLQTFKKEAVEMLQLGLPIIISQLSMVAMGVADTIQVGQIEGKSAVSVAAAGLSNSLFFTLAVIGLLAIGVVAPMISKAEAEKNEFEIRSLFRAAVRVALYLGLIIGSLCFIMGFFLDLLGQDAEVVALAKPFNMLISVSVIPMLLFNALRQLSDGLGKTRLAMVVALSALLLNIILNWFLINGLGIFPRLELLGAGVATLISRVYMMTALWFFIKRDKNIKVYLSPVKENLTRLVKQILTVGLPSGMQGFFEVAIFAGAVVIIGWYGKYQQAAHQIAINMCSVTYMMVTGVAAAGGIRVGHFWGLKDRRMIILSGSTALGIGAGFMALCAVIFFIFNNYLVQLYTTDLQVVPVAISLLIIGGFFQMSDGIQATALGILRGIADVNVPTGITLFAYWGVGLPIGLILGQWYGLKAAGVWIGLTAGLTASALLLCWRFYAMVKKIKI
jgi:multidrug resistance protein, MATE family